MYSVDEILDLKSEDCDTAIQYRLKTKGENLLDMIECAQIIEFKENEMYDGYDLEDAGDSVVNESEYVIAKEFVDQYEEKNK